MAESIFKQMGSVVSTALASEATARVGGDSTLQLNINAEVTARTTAVSNEATARIAGDNALDTDIGLEEAARIAADSALQTSINNEVTARTNAVSSLQTTVGTKLDATANAVSASKLVTARTISLSGAVTGSVSFDGSTNATISTTANASLNSLVAPEGKGIWGSIMTHSDRGNTYTNSWSSTRSWTSYYTYQAYSMNSYSQLMAAAFGDGYGSTGSSELTHIGDTNDGFIRKLMFASSNRIGRTSEQFHYSNNTSYSGEMVQIMPIRNPTGSNINATVYWTYSSYWSSGHDGSNCFVVTPNSTTASAVTAVTTTNLWSLTGSSSSGSASATITVPANTTVLLVLVTTDQYHTTYRFINSNVFYNLSALESAGLVCDMRVLSAMTKSRLNIPYTSSAAGTSIWTKAASDFGA